MIWTFRALACGCAVFIVSALGHAQDAPAPTSASNPAPAPAPLKQEEIASAERVDAVSIPTPGELMAALGKIAKPDWSAEKRPPIITSYGSRAQDALNLGGLIADGYIAVEAEDVQQVKNIGKDILALAKPLGVHDDILNRGKSLTDFAENGKWDVLKEELEATQNEVKAAMAEKNDEDLITLVTVGGWIRGTAVISKYIAAHNSEEGAKLLRQPAIVRFFSERLDALPDTDKMRDDPAVKKVRVRLVELEQAVSFPRDGAPKLENVQKIHQITSDLVKELSIKKVK